MSETKFEDIHKNKREIFFNNFLGGIAWGLGATFGVSILIALLGFIASQANLVPIVGSFVSEVVNFVLKNNPNLR